MFILLPGNQLRNLTLNILHLVNIHLKRIQILVSGEFQDLGDVHPYRLSLANRLGNARVSQTVGHYLLLAGVLVNS
jgi:hypothetical protein